jgi:hypothetical protein
LPVTTSLELPAARDVHSAIRDALDPVVRPLGDVGKKGGAAGWSLKENPGRLFFQFQLHPKATDSYQGGQFVIELERTLGEGRAGAFSGRARFDQLLTQAELETVLEHQNEVIASLPRPPASHVASYPEFLRDTYLEAFEPQGKFKPGIFGSAIGLSTMFGAGFDSSLACCLQSWAGPNVWDPHLLYLGSEIDLDADPLRPTNPLVITQKPVE